MTNNIRNWTYENVARFLQGKGFTLFEDVPGLGKAWMNFKVNGEPDRIVEFSRTQGIAYTPKALKKMIHQSGIAEEEWFKWSQP